MPTPILTNIIRNLTPMSLLMLMLWIIMRNDRGSVNFLELAGLVRGGVKRCIGRRRSTGGRARVSGCVSGIGA